MLAMERMGRRLANFSTHIGIDHENYSECFNHGFVELVKEKYGPNAWKKQRKRFTELSYTTMYKRLCRSNTGRKNKRKRNAVANRDEGVRRVRRIDAARSLTQQTHSPLHSDVDMESSD
mmetsp:Transcript_19473/g.64499  ORF Transcript_19473/g.64499 Transcript_19473/m.64499 type:complete len:119 (+) Transcript_19473:1350-1706(+)